MISSRQPDRIKLLFIIDLIYTLTAVTENQLVNIINNLPKNKYDAF